VRLALDRAEEARAVMLELFPEGFEEVDHPDGIELAAYTNAGGEERVWQVFGPGRAEPVESGWADAWRRFHRPVRVGPLWIGPPWETPDADALAVVVDPGRAFGTGSHPTTRLCLALLAEQPPGRLLDLGCGSGVLSIAGVRLGFGPVLGLDVDPAAIEATEANAAANGVTVDVRLSDATLGSLPTVDVAVANIALEAVEALAPDVDAATLVTSGYLVSDEPRPPGWRRRERRELDGWAADVFEPNLL
jgi:ribosomal protein L11 methyltransferase